MPSILCVSSSSCCCCLLFGKEVHISDCTQTGCLKDRKELPVFFKDRHTREILDTFRANLKLLVALSLPEPEVAMAQTTVMGLPF